MKPRNMPQRKLHRQQAAAIRVGTLDFLDADELIAVGKIRTKKDRTKVQPLPDKPKRGKRK